MRIPRNNIGPLLRCVALGMIIVCSIAATSQKQTPKSKHKRHHAKPVVVDSLPPPLLVVDTTSVDSSNTIRANLTHEINRWSKVRYRRGGLGVKGVDCSGFTLKVFEKALSIELPHSASAQSKLGERVKKDSLEFGDLLFFTNKRKRVNHVGIYLRDGTFAHSKRGVGVGLDSLSEHYYTRRFAGARRVIRIEEEPSSYR